MQRACTGFVASAGRRLGERCNKGRTGVEKGEGYRPAIRILNCVELSVHCVLCTLYYCRSIAPGGGGGSI